MIILGDGTRKTAYIHAVCSELEMRKEYLGGETIETIYWGGGTPSQLDKEDFETIFYYLHKNYSISSHPEITLEANVVLSIFAISNTSCC